METMKASDVMISFNVATMEHHAQELQRKLERVGYSVFLSTDMPGGANWQALINYNSAHCKIFIPFMNEAWCKSKGCRYETNIAIANNLYIYPLLLEDSTEKYKPYPIATGIVGNYQGLRANNLNDSTWETIVNFVRKVLPPGYQFVDHFVNIRSCHGTYLRAFRWVEGLWVGIDQQVGQSDWEKFYVEGAGDGKVALKTCHGTYVRANAEGQGARVDVQTSMGMDEKFTMERYGDKWAFKSHHGKYIRADQGGAGALVDLQTQVQDWELFDIIVCDTADPSAGLGSL